MARDAEDDIALEPLVLSHEDLGDEGLVALLEAEEVQVRRPIRLAPLRAQQFPDRAIGRDGVAGRPDRAERETTVGIGLELAPQVHVGLPVILVLVEPDGRGLPDIDLHAGDGGAIDIDDLAIDEEFRPRRRRAQDRAAIGGPR